MTRDEAGKEYDNLPPNEKKEYSCFEDYLGANGLTACEHCDNIVDYDEVDENGYCFENCSSEVEEDEEEEED